MLRACALVLVLAVSAADDEQAPAEVDRLRGYLAVAKDHGGLMYRLAQALAKAGQGEEAVRWLKTGLDQGLDLDLGDPAFRDLRERADFQEQRVRADAIRPVSTSRLAFRISQPDLIPEGIAWDARTGAYFVGSLYRKKIVRVDAEGRATDFVAAGQDGLEDVLGLKVDPEKRRLWICTAASPRAGPRAGSSGLLVYDIDSGKPVAAHWLRDPGTKHLLNDLVFTGSGEVFVTDSDAETVYRLASGGTDLTVFVGPGKFRYPNGIALDADEKRLYVADFEHGLSVVDIATQASRPVTHPPGVSTHGIDGLFEYTSDQINVHRPPA
jgi:hypothetical protein